MRGHAWNVAEREGDDAPSAAPRFAGHARRQHAGAAHQAE